MFGFYQSGIFFFLYFEDALSGCWFYHHSLMHQSWLKSSPARVSITNIDKFHSGITSRGATETRQGITIWHDPPTIPLWLLLATEFSWMSGEWKMVLGVWLWWREQTTSLETMQLLPASSHPTRRRVDGRWSVLAVRYVMHQWVW